MTIRPLLLRHGKTLQKTKDVIIFANRVTIGRLALPKPPAPNGTLRRYLSSTAIIRQQEQSITGSLASSTDTAPPSEIRDPTSRVAQDWAFYHHQKARMKHLGSTLAPHYRPHDLLSNPPRPQDITLELLLASQSHIGHATSLWHPSNARYIFGVRGRQDPIHVISLDVTASHLRRACKIVRGVTSRGGLVLFVGTRQGQARAVVRAAGLAGGCHLFDKWTPGSITNGQQILGSCQKMVVDESDKPIMGFADQLPDTSVLKPDLVVCLNPTENYILLHECGLHNIPTIGIIDTDASPTWVTYPIPANDDSLRCVQVIAGALGRAGEEGQAIRRAKARQGVVVSMPSHGLEPPREGQVEKEQETARQQAVLKQEEGEKWAAIAQEVPGGYTIAPPQPRQLEIDEAALESLDATAGALPEARKESAPEDLADFAHGMVEGEAAEAARDELDASLGDENPLDAFQPYERDRPLNDAEMAQAPSEDEMRDMDGDEGFGSGIRDREDR